MADPRLEETTSLDDATVHAVLDLARQVAAADGAQPLSDQSRLDVKYGAAGVEHLLLISEDGPVGYAHIATGPPAAVELVALDPPLVDLLARHVLDRVPAGSLVWAHGERSRVTPVLERIGLATDRVLLQLRRSLRPPIDPPVWPEGVTVRPFEVGRDEAAWLALNREAFADHPEQSAWTMDDLEHRECEEWFDPAGFFLAERDGELVGFHWTKVHPAAPPNGAPIGEVYVVGVSPAMQGRRLGSALTSVGLIHLRERGLGAVMLYVDEANTAAIHVYERLGFTRWDADVCFVTS